MKVEDWTSVNKLLKTLKPLILKLMKTNDLIILITSGKKIIRLRVYNLALKSLVEENNTKEKTKHIEFKELNMSEYLRQNKNTQISKEIFFYQGSNLGHNILA